MVFKGGLRRAVRLRALGVFLLSISFAIALALPPTLAQPVSDAEITALKHHGFELFQPGKYAEALPVAKQYAELIERRYGPAHSEYATALYYIAEVQRASNRLTEAEPLYVQALVIGEKSLGDEDPKLTEVLYGLAELCFSQARYRDAEL
jgi:tetratricopeptide (TPR) repeat protein